MPKREFPWSRGNEVLLATLEELGLPERLVTSMERDGVRLVGELLQMTEAEMLEKRGLGTKSLRLAYGILDSLGLAPETPLKGWNSERAFEARAKMGREIQKRMFELIRIEWKEHASLEDELRSLLLEVSNGRNAEMLSILFGFSGKGPQTLESTGQRYGLTRERVRQIAAKAENALASIWRPTAHLFAARDLMVSGLPRPFNAAEFSHAVKKASITEIDFHVEGVIRALALVGEPTAVSRLQIGGATLYGESSDRKFPDALLQRIRKDTSARGCVNVERLVHLCAPAAKDADEVRRLLSNFHEITWLDDERSWLMSSTVSRNRLANVTSGIFSVAPSLDMGTLIDSLHRPRRIMLVPPEAILASFLEINGIAKVTDGRADALPGFSPRELGMNDGAFVKAFRKLGSPVIRERLEEYCVDRLGVNVRSFYVNLSYSPLVVKVAPGVFSLIGDTVDPDEVERLKPQVKRSWHKRSE